MIPPEFTRKLSILSEVNASRMPKKLRQSFSVDNAVKPLLIILLLLRQSRG